MAIGTPTTGGVAYGSGSSLSVPYPSGIAAGDLLLLITGRKPSTANSGYVSDVAGWTAASEIFGGGYGATLGADTGNTSIKAQHKVADGSETGNLTLTLNTSNVSWGIIFRIPNTTKAWSVAVTAADDTSAGNVSLAFNSDPGVQRDDLVVGAMCIPTDVKTPSQFSAEALTQAGVTFGTVTEVAEPDTTTGNDLGGFVVRAVATAGQSSGAPTLTATAGGTTTNVRGPGILVRVRERLTAQLSAAGDLQALAIRQQQAAAALSGAGGQAAAWHDNSAQAALAGAGSLAADAVRIRTAAAVLAASGSLAAGAVRIRTAAAVLAASGSLAAAAQRRLSVAGALAAAGTLAATALRVQRADAFLSGTGLQVAAAGSTQACSAALGASGAIQAAAGVIRGGQAALAASGSLAASGDVSATRGDASPSRSAALGAVDRARSRDRLLSASITETGRSLPAADSARAARL